MLRLRTLVGLLLIGGLIWVLDPMHAATNLADTKVRDAFAKMGYPDPRYDIQQISLTHLRLANVQFEPEAISTIDEIDLTYRPWDILWGRIRALSILHPDIIFSADSPLPVPMGGLVSFLDLQTTSIEKLRIDDMTLSYAGDEISPSLTGSVNLTTDQDGKKFLSFQLSGAQKDLTLTFKGTATQSASGETHLRVQIPEARMELPDLMLARGNGDFSVILRNGHPIKAEGKFASGAARIGKLRLSGITADLGLQKDGLSFIADTDLIDVARAHMSIRIQQKQNIIQGLAQLSGESPKDIAARMFPSSSLPLPAQKKFALAYLWDGSDLSNFFAHISNGKLFVYDEAATPVLQLSISCPHFDSSCSMDLPATQISAAQISSFAGPALADKGLVLSSGLMAIAAHLTPFSKTSFIQSLGVSGKDVDMTWQNLRLSQARGAMRFTPPHGFALSSFSARALGGILNITDFRTDNKGEATLQISLSDADLSDVTRFLGVRGLYLTGTGEVVIPLFYRAGAPFINDVIRITGKNGALSYAPITYPDYLVGRAPQRKALRTALQNFQFNSLDLTAQPVKGRLQGILTLTGQAPDLYGAQDVSLKVEGSGAVPAALDQILPRL